MKKGRRNFPAKFKAKVALEAVEGGQTLAELSTKHEVHAAMISTWKKTLTDRAEEIFDTQRGRPGASGADLTARLYQQIGELQTELSWLKKKLGT
jgi:transposase-like protein